MRILGGPKVFFFLFKGFMGLEILGCRVYEFRVWSLGALLRRTPYPVLVV